MAFQPTQSPQGERDVPLIALPMGLSLKALTTERHAYTPQEAVWGWAGGQVVLLSCRVMFGVLPPVSQFPLQSLWGRDCF